MQFIETISLGEAIVGGGTLILAIVTVGITAWQIREARRVWRRGVDRDYKRKILDEMERWLQSMTRALNEDAYSTKQWLEGDVNIYLDEKAKLLEKLMVLSDEAFFISKKAKRPFEEYDVEGRFNKVRNEHGNYTDMLHDMVENRPDGVGNELANCEIELMNMINEFYKYLLGIRDKEKI
jgi:hypothetical protein